MEEARWFFHTLHQSDVAPLVLNANRPALKIRLYVDKQTYKLETNRSLGWDVSFLTFVTTPPPGAKFLGRKAVNLVLR